MNTGSRGSMRVAIATARGRVPRAHPLRLPPEKLTYDPYGRPCPTCLRWGRGQCREHKMRGADA